MLGTRQEIENHVRYPYGGQPWRGPLRPGRGRSGISSAARRATFVVGERRVARQLLAERMLAAVFLDEPLSSADDLERVRASHSSDDLAPGSDAVTAEHGADRIAGGRAGGAATSRPSWNPGRRHGSHSNAVAEALAGQPLAIGRSGEGNSRIRMEVVHVGRVDESVHRSVDRRRRATSPVKAEVEQAAPCRPRVRRRRTHRPARGAGRDEAQPGRPRSGFRDRPRTPSPTASSIGLPVTGSTPTPLAEVLPPA